MWATSSNVAVVVLDKRNVGPLIFGLGDLRVYAACRIPERAGRAASRTPPTSHELKHPLTPARTCELPRSAARTHALGTAGPTCPVDHSIGGTYQHGRRLAVPMLWTA